MKIANRLSRLECATRTVLTPAQERFWHEAVAQLDAWAAAKARLARVYVVEESNGHC